MKDGIIVHKRAGKREEIWSFREVRADSYATGDRDHSLAPALCFKVDMQGGDQVLFEINVKNVPIERLRFQINQALDELEKRKADWVD